MVCFFPNSMAFLPSPMVARSASGSNSRFFLATAAELIVSNSTSKVALVRHNHFHVLACIIQEWVEQAFKACIKRRPTCGLQAPEALRYSCGSCQDVPQGLKARNAYSQP